MLCHAVLCWSDMWKSVVNSINLSEQQKLNIVQWKQLFMQKVGTAGHDCSGHCSTFRWQRHKLCFSHNTELECLLFIGVAACTPLMSSFCTGFAKAQPAVQVPGLRVLV